MAVFPARENINIFTAENAVVRARITNGDGDSMHYIGATGRQVFTVNLAVFDLSGSTPATAVYTESWSHIDGTQTPFTLANWTESALRLEDTQMLQTTRVVEITGGTGATLGYYGIDSYSPSPQGLIFYSSIGSGADGAGDTAGTQFDQTTIEEILTTQSQGLLTEGWTLDGTGYQFLHVMAAADIPGGAWLADRKYKLVYTLTTDAVTATEVGTQAEGPQQIVRFVFPKRV